MYDFTQDFTDYQKLVPNADLTVKPPSTGNTQPQGYDFTKDLESYRKIAPDMSGLESVNDPLIKKAQLAQEKQTEEDKKKLQLAADLMITSGYSPDPEGVASAQITEGARKSLAGMQDRILGKSGVITQRFGNKNPIEKFSGGVNYGTDIGVDRGTKVSVPPGKWKVMEAYSGAEEGKEATNRGYGNSILVQNQETGEKMRFSHLSQVGVRPGEIVDGNKIVGATGSTGNSTGPHLDLEMYDRSGRLIDILNTPYSSYLGLGQGGGSGKGGGNPMMDKITQVGRQALESAVPLLQVPQRAKEFLYDPQTSRIAPQSPLWELSDITNIQDPKERRRRLIDWSSNMSMALSTGKTPETSYIKGEEQGTRNILGGVHNPGAPSEKGIFNVIIKDAKGNKIGNRIYEDSVSAQRAIERIALEPNQQALVQKLDVMPGPDGLAPLDVKKAKIGKDMIKPSTGGENPLIQEARKYKSAEDFVKSKTQQKYRSAHQLGLSDSITADKIDVKNLKEEIRKRNGYLNNYNLKDLKKLEKLQNNPNAEVTIYRASPVNELNDGDWVTTDKTYANDIKRQNGGKVYSYTAKVSDLRFPNDVETLPSLSMASTFSYSPKTSKLTDIWNKAQSSGREIGGIDKNLLKKLDTSGSSKLYVDTYGKPQKTGFLEEVKKYYGENDKRVKTIEKDVSERLDILKVYDDIANERLNPATKEVKINEVISKLKKSATEGFTPDEINSLEIELTNGKKELFVNIVDDILQKNGVDKVIAFDNLLQLQHKTGNIVTIGLDLKYSTPITRRVEGVTNEWLDNLFSGKPTSEFNSPSSGEIPKGRTK